MKAETRPAPFLVADHPALDFLNTVATPWGERIEWLEDGSDLLSWLQAAGLIQSAEARRLSRTWGADALDAAAEEARELREWFRGVVSRRKSGGPDAVTARDLVRLNELLSRAVVYPQIERVSERCVVRPVRRWHDPGDLLVVVAEVMAGLLAEADPGLTRRCANPECTLWFYDRTKAHTRRWCSMAVCGNRVKAASHRQRERCRERSRGR